MLMYPGRGSWLAEDAPFRWRRLESTAACRRGRTPWAQVQEVLRISLAGAAIIAGRFILAGAEVVGILNARGRPSLDTGAGGWEGEVGRPSARRPTLDARWRAGAASYAYN